ncbi:MAG: hypothetical protein MJB57_02345, partial [Gemmatimonadetes bacterium]|nr:hypothetical protein [Gemmatimonadota bacterium]
RTTLGIHDDPDMLSEARTRILDQTGGLDQILQNHRDPTYQWRFSTPLRTDRNDQEDSAEEAVVYGTTVELTAIYVHDGFNRRVIRWINGDNIYMSAYDGWREVEELVLDVATNKTVPIKRFVWGDRLDEQIAYQERDGASGAWDTYFLTNGGQDSVIRIVNTAGTV